MSIRLRDRFGGTSLGRAGWFLVCALGAILSGGIIAFFGGWVSYFVVGLLVVLLTAALAIRYERVPFFLLVVIIPLETLLNSLVGTNLGPFSATVLIVPVGLAAFAWLARLAVYRSRIALNRPATVLAILLGVWATLSALSAGGVGDVVQYARSYWMAILVFFLAQVLLREERHLVGLGWVMALTLGILGLITLLDMALFFIESGGSLGGAVIHRYAQHESAVGTVSGVLGMRLTKGIPFAVYLAQRHLTRHRVRRYVLWSCAACMVLGAAVGLSINAAVGLLVTLGLMGLGVQNRARRAGLIALAICVAVLLFVATPLAERLEVQSTVIQEEDFVYWGTGRGQAWTASWIAMQSAPFLGNGLGSARVSAVLEAHLTPGVMDWIIYTGSEVAPHNILLSIGVETGFPGLFLFIILFAYIMFSLWRQVRHLRARAGDARIYYVGLAILVGLAALLIQGMGVSLHLDKFLWLLLGLGSAFPRIAQHALQSGDSLVAEEGARQGA